MNKNSKLKILAYISSVFAIVFIWILLAKAVSAPLILPYPGEVWSSLVIQVKRTVFWQALGQSFLRVLCAFLFSAVLGIFVGLARGFSGFLDAFFEIPLAALRSTPVISIILLALFWFSSNTVPVFVAVLLGVPLIADSVTGAVKQKNAGLDEMARIYQFSAKQKFLYIELPKIRLPLYFSLETLYGLCWKVVTAGEVLSIPRRGVGSLLQNAQVHLNTADVISLSVLLVFVSFTSQKIIFCRRKPRGKIPKEEV